MSNQRQTPAPEGTEEPPLDLLREAEIGLWEYDVSRSGSWHDPEWIERRLGELGHLPDGKDFHGQVIHPRDLPRFNRLLLDCLEGKRDGFEMDYRILSAVDHEFWIRSSARVAERGKDRQALRIVGSDRVIDRSEAVSWIPGVERWFATRLLEADSIEEVAGLFGELLEEHFAIPDYCVLQLPAAGGGGGARVLANRLFDLRKVDPDSLLAVLPEDSVTLEIDQMSALRGIRRYLPERLRWRTLVTVSVAGISSPALVVVFGVAVAPALIRAEEEVVQDCAAAASRLLRRMDRESAAQDRGDSWEAYAESANDRVLVLSRNGGVCHASPSACKTFGWEVPDDYAGVRLQDLCSYPDSAREEIEAILAGDLDGLAISLRARSGAVELVELAVRPGTWAGEPVLFCGLRGTGRNRRSLTAMRERDEALRSAAIALGRMIAVDTETPGATGDILGDVGAAFGARRIVLYEAVAESTGSSLFQSLLVWSGKRGANPLPSIRSAQWRELPHEEEEERFFKLGMEKLSLYQRDLLRCEAMGVVYFLPIRVREQDWGLLRIDLPPDRAAFSEGNYWVLGIIGSSMASHLVRVRLEAQLRDTTRQAEATNQQLVEAMRKTEVAMVAADHANRSKSEFLSSISHEIRTPLNAILGFAALLSEEVGDLRQREYLSAINTSGKALLSLINDLLDLSRIEAGKMTMNPRFLDLRQLVSEVERVFYLKASKKGLVLSLRTNPRLPRLVRLDETRLRQILINLIGNAVKFTDHGSIAVEVDFEVSRSLIPTGVLRIRVVDTGPGIDAALVDRIFEPFERITGERTEKEGSGLGLAISHRLIDLMNGVVEYRPNQPHGSVFEIAIPEVDFQIETGGSSAVPDGILTSMKARESSAVSPSPIRASSNCRGKADPSTIEAIRKQWHSVLGRMQVSLIQKFLREVGKLVARHPGIPGLEQWHTDTEAALQSFNIGELRNLLPEFPEDVILKHFEQQHGTGEPQRD